MEMKNEIYDIIVVGAGPAGIGFINTINGDEDCKVALIDAGDIMDNRQCRILDNEKCCNCKRLSCQMVHGVGGASLLGGHKISCFPAGTFINNIMVKEYPDMNYYRSLLEKLSTIIKLRHTESDPGIIEKASQFYSSLKYEFKYYNSYICNIENLKQGYKILLKEKKNVHTFYNTRILSGNKKDNLFILSAVSGNRKRVIKGRKLVLAVGRAGNELLKQLNTDLVLGATNNHMEIGVRIEFPSYCFPDIDKYHNDLKLKRGNIRTFCVSKQGMLAPYYCNDLFIVDGFFDIDKPTGFTNLALMYRLSARQENSTLLKTIQHNSKQKYNQVPIIQNYTNLITGNRTENNQPISSSINFLTRGRLEDLYPASVLKPLLNEIHYFVKTFFREEDYHKINIIAPALEYFWPDFPIKDDFSVVDDVYMIGDCTGKYRGILQAFVAGAILGDKIVK